MDMEAYMQIDELSYIAKENNIEVPRLRGYRLMKDEQFVPKDELKKIMDDYEIHVCDDLCRSRWNPNSCEYEFNDKTDRIYNFYVNKSTGKIRWDRIHGKKRKILKFEIKKQNKRILKQFNMFNKYAGKENVLYIHARVGGSNWDYYGCNELTKLPWFLEKVDDCFDSTYCDIYASIK